MGNHTYKLSMSQHCGELMRRDPGRRLLLNQAFTNPFFHSLITGSFQTAFTDLEPREGPTELSGH